MHLRNPFKKEQAHNKCPRLQLKTLYIKANPNLNHSPNLVIRVRGEGQDWVLF